VSLNNKMKKEDKQQQYSIEQLERKINFWDRFHFGAGITTFGIFISSVFIAPGIVNQFRPDKSEEVVRYENALKTYDWV